MDFYKLIQEQRFNEHTAMDIECILVKTIRNNRRHSTGIVL